jgi:hypothetical protein
MAVVANQAVAFDKSMLMACPHLGDVLRPGLILVHGPTGRYYESESLLGHSGLPSPGLSKKSER